MNNSIWQLPIVGSPNIKSTVGVIGFNCEKLYRRWIWYYHNQNLYTFTLFNPKTPMLVTCHKCHDIQKKPKKFNYNQYKQYVKK